MLWLLNLCRRLFTNENQALNGMILVNKWCKKNRSGVKEFFEVVDLQ